ncbi:MAG: aminopeptidase [Pyramidobacter sp.]|nr:aminopeptidase [Pyramidobacter sp.]
MSQNSFADLYPSAWKGTADRSAVMAFAKDYREFVSRCKTERETAAETVRAAREAGFRDLDELCAAGAALKAGDKIYVMRQNKAAAFFVIGERPLTDGLRLICSHADAPRLDLRPNPLYEKDGMALMKTHYYGGIKKYQWTAVPLALHGVAVKKGGERVSVVIGEDANDPVLYISDLPAHLAADQYKKKLADGIAGEELNLIVGSIPLDGDKTEGVKAAILGLLKEKYGIDEKDFASAEFEIVPAGGARDAGLDASLIASYAHDDRICVYPAFRSLLETERPAFTSGVLFVDKEEVGSQGNSGMNSHLMENIVSRLVRLSGGDPFDRDAALENSVLLSADVCVGYDPNFPSAFEPNNTARLGSGPVLMKYAGARGKAGANDASAELMAFVRDIFDEAGVSWQIGGMGRIDLGGGGTIAPFAARYGMQVLDCGVALLSMHAPCELASKADIYETYRGYKAFLNSAAEMKNYLG